MSAPRVLIPTGFGLNCEAETSRAFEMAGAVVDQVHWTDLFTHRHGRRLTDYRTIGLIGGFAYGDHIAGGFVLATRVRAHLQQDLADFLANGGTMVGICNGFQTLVRLGLLPGPAAGKPDFVPRAALNNNDRLGYRNAWVQLGVDSGTRSVWTRGLQTLEMPSRHGEGKLIFESDAALDALEKGGQVVFRYLDAEGQPTESWPHNPNGTARAIAGICDPSGRVLGVMPHPEAFLHPWQHPDWRRRRKELEAREPAVVALFRNGLAG